MCVVFTKMLILPLLVVVYPLDSHVAGGNDESDDDDEAANGSHADIKIVARGFWNCSRSCFEFICFERQSQRGRRTSEK